MKHKSLWLAVVISVFLLSALSSAYLLLRPHPPQVEIISDGKVLYTLTPASEPDRQITVEYQGRRNIILVQNGEIFVSEADCPDHTCVKMGKLSEDGLPIVCLPNKLMIRYKPQ